MTSALISDENNNITSLVQKESSFLNTNKNNSQYLNLSVEELTNEINDRKKKIMEYHDKNKVLKKELTNILEKLNTLSNQNKEQLKEMNENEIQNLLSNKQTEYLILKNNNRQLKNEYNTLFKKGKITSVNQIIDMLSNEKINIQKIKNENRDIKKEISKSETEKYKQQNKILKIKNNHLTVKIISNFSDKLNKYLQMKNNFISSLNKSNNIIKDNKQELNKLEKLIQNKKKLIEKNEKINNKINEEISIIKNDLSGTVEEIVQRCIDDNVQIYSLINNKNISCNTHKSISTCDKNTGFDEPRKNCSISSNVSIVHCSLNKKNNDNSKSNSVKNKIRLYPSIYRNKSQSFITDKVNLHENSNYNIYNNLKSINELISENDIINNRINERKNNNTNRITNKSTSCSNIKKVNIIKNCNSLSMDLKNLDYKQVDENMYLKILNKKKYYVDENERIDFNIKEIKKTFNTKYNNTSNIINANIIKLNEIKALNINLQEEITKLQQLMKEIQSNNNIKKTEETKK